jgi:rfaE bifunctional protein kinase chain/domain
MSQRILVVGDVMLDILRTGECYRMSPEAPDCPVLSNQEIEHNLGGAANVAQWLAAIPGFSVALLGITGMDDCSQEFRLLCASNRITWIDLNPIERGDILTAKERIYRRDPVNDAVRQIARLDRDSDVRLRQEGYQHLDEALAKMDPAALVVADYGKGVFEGLWGEEAIGMIARHARKIGVPLFVNSKYPDRWAEAGATMLVCNRDEFTRAWPRDTWQQPAPKTDYLIVTLGEHGATLYDHPSTKVPCRTVNVLSAATNVVDVTGAGDAFLAGIVYETMTRRRGFPYDFTCEDLESILVSAQHWAACCCSQIGVGTPIGDKE